MIAAEPITHGRVVQLAAELFGQTLGLDFPGRVFLAGGVFKSLLHGHPPRDLDLWAPTTEDRALLVEWLLRRRAVSLARHAYSDVFLLGGHELEVPDEAGPDTLESRLRRFDLGLSGVGVELSGGRIEGCILPEAMESVRMRTVLLIKPLPNPKHILGTIARARRYASELGWSVSVEDEVLAWSVFETAPQGEQDKMLERYQKAALQGWGVYEEAIARRARSAGVDGPAESVRA